MRLRRFEVLVISVTLAFACFVGGYFVGRRGGSVSIAPTVVSQSETISHPPQLHTLIAPTPTIVATEPVPEPYMSDATITPAETVLPQPTMQEQPVVLPPISSRDAHGRININTATRTELMDLPGIGSSLSERIVAYRTANGPFRTIEELRNISGIGERRFEAIMDKITVG